MLRDHLLSWSGADVEEWCLTAPFPPNSKCSTLLKGMDGTALWNLTIEELRVLESEGASEGHMPQEELEQLLVAVSSLRAKYERDDLIAALNIQSEVEPSLADAQAHVRQEGFDQAYSHMVHSHEIDKQRASYADAELASRLAREASLGAMDLRLAQVEEQRRLDHELARRLQHGGEDQVQNIIDTHGQDVLTEPAFEAEETVRLEERDAGAAGGAGDKVECFVCMDMAEDCTTFDCNHSMCRECLKDLFRVALSDVSMLPVTCCGVPLRPQVVRKVLTQEEEAVMIERLREKDMANKMFCPKPQCSHLIDLDVLTRNGFPASGKDIACVACQSMLCIVCKAEAHDASVPCQPAAEDPALVALAYDQGWRRCENCLTYVALKHGCNHITCICGHEFCYTCGVAWQDPKACACDLWSERMLLREEERRLEVAEEQLGRPLQLAERAALRQQLNVANHQGQECSHRSKETLQYREFAGNRRRTCNNCDQSIRHYCYECTECGFRVCQVCRYNRRLP